MMDHPARDVPKYSPASRMLHWIVAMLVFLTWPLGLMLDFVKDDVKLDFYLVHESLGFLILWIMLLRLGVRLFTPAPRSTAPAVERIAAHMVPRIALPLPHHHAGIGFSGNECSRLSAAVVRSAAYMEPNRKSPDIAPTFSTIHEWSAWIILALFALHMLAVIFHHLIRRDATLYRILKGTSMRNLHMTDRLWTKLLSIRDGKDTLRRKEADPALMLYGPIAAGRDGFVIAQVGQSLDGRVATPTGDAATFPDPMAWRICIGAARLLMRSSSGSARCRTTILGSRYAKSGDQAQRVLSSIAKAN